MYKQTVSDMLKRHAHGYLNSLVEGHDVTQVFQSICDLIRCFAFIQPGAQKGNVL